MEPVGTQAASDSFKNTFYKYEEINLETYPLHKSESENKPPIPGPSPQKRTKLPSAGDIWIPYTPQEQENRTAGAKDLIIHHAKILAREGKRVAQLPSYLEGGIVVHWVRDYSMKEEQVEPLLQALGKIAEPGPERGPARGGTEISQASEKKSISAGVPIIISLLSDDDRVYLPETDARISGGFCKDQPIVVDSDEEDIAEVEPKPEASAQELMASAPTLRQAHSTRRFPPLAINERDNRSQDRTDVNPGSERLLNGEETSLQKFPPEEMMRNHSTSHSLAREQSRVPTLSASGSAGTETCRQSRSPSEQSPELRSRGDRVSTPSAPQLTEDHYSGHDVDVDAPEYSPGLAPSELSLVGLRREKMPQREGTNPTSNTATHTPRRGVRTMQIKGRDSDLYSSGESTDSETEDATSCCQSSPPRYVSPARRNDLATVLLAGPAHIKFNPSLTTRFGESPETQTPALTRNPNSNIKHASIPIEGVTTGRRSSPSGSSNRSTPDLQQKRIPSKRKSTSLSAGSGRKKIVRRSPQSSSSQSDSSSEGDDTVPDVDRRSGSIWTASDQQHVENCLKTRNGRSVHLPIAPHERARRLLVPSDDRCPLTAVYMRGDTQFIHKTRLYRISHYSLPAPGLRGVADACLLNDNSAVVGYAAGSTQPQVSVLILDAGLVPRRVDVAHRGHSTIEEHRSIDTSSPNAGISCLAPLRGPKLTFLSGGHDKTMRMWTLNVVNGEFIGHSQRLIADHSYPVQALAHSPYNNSVFSASGPFIHTTDLAQRAGSTKQERLSNRLRQIHPHTETPHVIILEVDHLDYQMEVYDTRAASFSRPACNRFGFRDTGRMHARSFFKGSSLGSYFARGYSDGQVLIWDLRDLRNVATEFNCQRDAAIVHTVLSERTVMAYGQRVVTFWDRRANAV